MYTRHCTVYVSLYIQCFISIWQMTCLWPTGPWISRLYFFTADWQKLLWFIRVIYIYYMSCVSGVHTVCVHGTLSCHRFHLWQSVKKLTIGWLYFSTELLKLFLFFFSTFIDDLKIQVIDSRPHRALVLCTPMKIHI